MGTSVIRHEPDTSNRKLDTMNRIIDTITKQ
jgi:hypothetical protein